MSILVIDTPTSQVTVGIVHDGETVTEKLRLDIRIHNEMLVPLIQQCLTDSGMAVTELDAAIVGCRPGLFTGLRVGIATTASSVNALGIPCHGICNLDVLVDGAGDELVATDACRREAYFAVYHDDQRASGPIVAKPVSVMELFREELVAEAVSFAPSHARDNPDHIRQVAGLEATAKQVFPVSTTMVKVTRSDSAPNPLVLLYLRRPDVIVPKAMK